MSKQKLREKEYRRLEKNCFLAELIGIILGDGCVTKMARCDLLRISCDSRERDYIIYVAHLIRQVFKKQPSFSKRKNENCIDIRLYQKYISSRLRLPTGNKIANNIDVPRWVFSNSGFIRNCLKGLFDTDGNYRKDERNYLHVIELKNRCLPILKSCYKMLKLFGYHPQFGGDYVRLARKEEVYNFIGLINFRNRYCPVV